MISDREKKAGLHLTFLRHARRPCGGAAPSPRSPSAESGRGPDRSLLCPVVEVMPPLP